MELDYMTNTLSFLKIGKGINKLMEMEHIHRGNWFYKLNFICFKIREVS
jgi:hypothetical protein